MPGGNNNYKVTYTFQDINGASWNEVYSCGGSLPTDIATANNPFVTARLFLLNPTNILYKVRVAQVGQNRVTAQQIYNLNGNAKSNSFSPAPPSTAAVIQLYGINGGQRKIWLRGFPQDWIDRDASTGRDVLVTTFSSYLKSFVSMLFKNQYGIITLSPNRQRYPIASVAGTGETGLALVTYTVPAGAVAPVLANKTRVIIGGADKKTLPSFNGYFTVINAGVNTFNAYYQTPGGANVVNNCGYFSLASFNSLSIINPANYQFLYFGEHSTKNPVGPSRGSRRAARIRLSV